MKVKPVIMFRILFVVYILAVFYLCLARFQPNDDIPKEIFNIPLDKVMHFMMFLPFVPLTYLSFHVDKGKLSSVTLFCAVVLLIGCIMAGGIEIIQGMTSYRSKDIVDFVADVVGLCTGVLLTFIYDSISHKI